MPTAPEDRYHYQIIRRAIEEIDAAETPLALDELAARMGLSTAHFQRLFSAWAGISPKRYQQYLGLGRAREMLRARETLLETAAATGLSGPGRLHDLVLRWDAMRPGELARGGEGLRIDWALCPSPYGPALVMATAHGICGIAFTAETGAPAAQADLRARWPAARYHEDPQRILPLAEAAFAGRRTEAHVMGGPFQIKVWEALLQIPEGQVTSYSALAGAIGHPGASRAIGSAVGRNPLSLLIPCHRVLRKDGALGGYHWGLPVKRAMLARESARTEAAA
ncbi:methylated-DNA--[protein]-cysteine S-methyltransferase [Oceanicola sp. S124]|uniref:methylated-DNA--[protein]-cysteine S-methyltransferase n=1 Tax=Oceanicola sp. S124 TaxID=1042378 RepID=UPI00025589E6|nr:methylated-DNA--[protein]-cysteine S-methyltransferase [Oceanicola sp. S124]